MLFGGRALQTGTACMTPWGASVPACLSVQGRARGSVGLSRESDEEGDPGGEVGARLASSLGWQAAPARTVFPSARARFMISLLTSHFSLHLLKALSENTFLRWEFFFPLKNIITSEGSCKYLDDRYLLIIKRPLQWPLLWRRHPPDSSGTLRHLPGICFSQNLIHFEMVKFIYSVTCFCFYFCFPFDLHLWKWDVWGKRQHPVCCVFHMPTLHSGQTGGWIRWLQQTWECW